MVRLQTDSPKPEISHDGLLINYRVAGTHVYCRFKYRPDQGIMEFGYHKESLKENAEDAPVTHLYFDRLGNVRTNSTDPSAAWSIRSSDDIGQFFFSRILKAVQSALDA